MPDLERSYCFACRSRHFSCHPGDALLVQEMDEGHVELTVPKAVPLKPHLSRGPADLQVRAVRDGGPFEACPWGQLAEQ